MSYNEEYYLANNPDVAMAVRQGVFGSGWQHYQAFGQYEDRVTTMPAGYGAFNETYYLANNPDVAMAVEQGVFGSGWQHFSIFGLSEGRSAEMPEGYGSFNEEYYLANHPDVAMAVRQGVFGSGWQHYQAFGQYEGRSTSAPTNYLVVGFNEEYYLANNPDVGMAVEQGVFGSGWQHYLLFGKTEGRSFDNPYVEGTPGQTFMLTKGLDVMPGLIGDKGTTDTSGDDTIIGSLSTNAELNTLSALDVINAGDGIDTLKINHENLTPVESGEGGGDGHVIGAIPLPKLSNVEIIEISSVATEGLRVDTTATTGVTDLNIIRAAGAVNATAGATTDISVDIKSQSVETEGGNDVTVTVADVDGSGDSVTIGDTTAPKGDVVVEASAKAAVNGTDITMGDITVTGGTTISVTQTVGDASGLVAGDAETTHTQGAVTITAGATTTDVTVKQDKAVDAASVKAVEGVTEVASVKFTDLDAEESVTVGGLTFKASEDLTAAQVAAAFANLRADAITPTNIDDPATTASGDTNGGSALANGFFTGSLLAGWSSAAASGDTVVFTGTADTAMTDLTATNATVTTTTQGVTAVSAENTLGVVNGTVTITGGAALETVSVDGYAASSSISGGSNDALDTISLANGSGSGDFVIESAAATLDLTLDNVSNTVDVQVGTKTLNATVTGDDVTSTLKSASATAVNVSGTGNVYGDATVVTGILTAATAINTSGMTAGSATFIIGNGTTTAYTGGAGVDSVTVSNANVAITKAIDLGAGDDTLTLGVSGDTTVVVPTATLKGGTGTGDIIAMTGASAESLSANSTFAGKIEGFEKLGITDKVTEATTVNMANMDGIDYVVSANTTAVATEATKTTFTLDVTGSTAEADDTVAFDGSTYTFTAEAASASAFATQLYALISVMPPIGGNWVATGVSGTKITFEAVTAGVKATPTSTAFVFTDDTSGDTATFVTEEVTAGTGPSTAPALTIDNMANDGTLELVASGDGVVVTMDDATGATDSFNIVTRVTDTDLDFGTVDVAGVETLNLNAVDSTPVDEDGVATISTATLDVKADKATSLTIEGNSNLILTLDATTTKLATINASALEGDLVAGNTHADEDTIAMTITGGTGDDTLTASTGTNAKADVLDGGDGDDTLYAGSNGAKLTGGDGNDLFIVTSAATDDGNKESNTYSTIEDFTAGDLLQLQYYDGSDTADVSSFAKLEATLDEGTAVFSDFANAAIKEADAGEAVWFNFGDAAYIVIDNNTDSTGDVFINGEDLVIKLTGVDGNNLSWNSDFATVALV